MANMWVARRYSGQDDNSHHLAIDFEVKDPLPNVTFALRRNFAGNIPVDRPGHPNDTLFFWAFEHENGSLTSDTNLDKPWAIWLNGGFVAASYRVPLFD